MLPPELRLKIWHYNMPEPRIVSVRCGARSPSSSLPSLPLRRHCLSSEDAFTACSPACSSHSSSSSSPSPTLSPSPSPSPPPPSSYSPPGWCTSTATLPVNLSVCHESRTEALRRYALMFGIARQPGYVYFDPSRDILYFGPREGYMAAEAQLRTLLVLAEPEELALVQRVALSEGVLDHTGSSSSASTNLAVDVLHQLRTRLPSLRELIVVPRDETAVDSSDAVLVPLPMPPVTLPLGGPSMPCTQQQQLDPDNSEINVPNSEATKRLAKQIHTAMRR
ncbi:hypothetical protein Sste5346_003218 [Sporothrix stenoceras]|uniref:2EXR domain-containing protein n=1 Tax=Sporothrix stenoceras TaxID=5173 RepID=A0ABR3ZEM0_9PEZI